MLLLTVKGQDSVQFIFEKLCLKSGSGTGARTETFPKSDSEPEPHLYGSTTLVTVYFSTIDTIMLNVL